MDQTRLRSVSDAYEPGSIIKALTMAICLQANKELQQIGRKKVFDPEEMIATSNGFFPGRSKELKDPRRHSYLNMNLAMSVSSNIYMATMVQRTIEALGNDWYRSKLTDVFGFGEKTNIEFPYESSGLVPTPGRLHPNGTLEWSKSTPYSLAIGHNILVTSFQMLRAYATLANGGYLVEPTFVRKIIKKTIDGEEEILLDNTSESRKNGFKKVLDSDIVDRVVTAMKFVTRRGGSAYKSEVNGFMQVGKTGTANKIVNGQYSKKKYLSSFIGFGPLSNPQFVILVSIDEPNPDYDPAVGNIYWGGQCAAPVYREIVRKTLQYMGISPDDPYSYPVGDPRRCENKAEWIKETNELMELYKKWNG